MANTVIVIDDVCSSITTSKKEIALSSSQMFKLLFEVLTDEQCLKFFDNTPKRKFSVDKEKLNAVLNQH